MARSIVDPDIASVRVGSSGRDPGESLFIEPLHTVTERSTATLNVPKYTTQFECRVPLKASVRNAKHRQVTTNSLNLSWHRARIGRSVHHRASTRHSGGAM